MCGIGGYILKEAAQHDDGCAAALLAGVRRRGPDDEGMVFIDRASRKAGDLATHDAALVHARFAIIDTTAGGHQPFESGDGKCTAVFNGEIYNYLELKQELARDGVVFRSASDTEVLVEGWRRWRHGLWEKMNGFWAVALYDAEANEIVLARDRLGVAPLYYRQTGRGFYFSSLIAPLCRVAPGGDEIDTDALRGFIEEGLKDHDGTTMYRHVRSLPPASTISWRYGAGARLEDAQVRSYWSLPDAPLTERDISLPEAARQLHDVLLDAVRLRLRADVPVAFELSGGLDSSSVVALAAELGGARLTAYTIKARGRDETRYAAALARRYNIDHRVLAGIEEDLPRDAADFARVMEEPYDTPANYVHHRMLLRIKADGFKVVVTGAGGDESLAGYEASFWPAARRALQEQGHGAQAEWYEFCRRFGTWQRACATLSNYPAALARRMGFCRGLTPERRRGLSRAAAHQAYHDASGFHARRLFHFRVGLLPYYLRSTDHYTMNIPVEHRFPLLDYRVVELGIKMPAAYLFHNGWTKYVLRRAMASALPGEVLWRRRKMGFPFDLAGYLPRYEKFLAPHLDVLAAAGFAGSDHQTQARRDPGLAWRRSSAGIWLKNA